MTIKEISKLLNVSRETVRKKGKELFPERFVHGKTTTFLSKQSGQIIGELKAIDDVVSVVSSPDFVENTYQNEQKLTTLTNQGITSNDITLLVNSVSDLIKVVHLLVPNITSLTDKRKSTKQLIQSNVRVRKSPNREKLNKMIDNAVNLYDTNYPERWAKLWENLYDKTNIDIDSILEEECKFNPKIKALDIIEQRGLLETCIIIVHEWKKPFKNSIDEELLFDDQDIT